MHETARQERPGAYSIGRNGGIEERTDECPAGKGEDGTAAKGAGADAERSRGGDACVAEVGEAW